MALPSGLLEDVKSYLDITWTLSADEEKKLTGIIGRGMMYLDRIAGHKCDYSKEGQHKALLLDYVRYVRSNAFDEYQNNYLHEILALQMNGEEVVPDDPQSPEIPVA